MRKKLVILLLLVALLPLAAYGTISVMTARHTTSSILSERQQELARRAASEIALYVRDSVTFLHAGARYMALGHVFDLAKQRERLHSAYLHLKRFKHIDVFQPDGKGLGFYPPDLAEDGVPRMTIRLPVIRQRELVAILKAELDLSEMWNEVERIRVGKTGHLLIFGQDYRLLAHGDPKAKTLIFRPDKLTKRTFLEGLNGPGAFAEGRYTNEQGIKVQATAVTLPDLGLESMFHVRNDEPAPDLDLGIKVVVEQSISELEALESGLTQQLMATAGIILVLMLGMSWLLGERWFTRPFNQLVEATKRVASGDLSARVGIIGKDEVARLGEAFDAMTGELSKLEEKVRRQERIATIGQIATGLAHDLKHPIQNLKNATRLLVTMADDREAVEDFHELVKSELQRLEIFLDDLYHVNKKEKEHINLTTVDAVPILENVARVKADNARSKGVALILDAAATKNRSQLKVIGDHVALHRVLDNLVGNALDATSKGDRVILTIDKKDDVVVFMVEDTGHGIAQDRIEAIFDPFISTKTGGMGMGLAVSKRLTEAMGGRIKVRSSEGVGTTFTVELSTAPLS